MIAFSFGDVIHTKITWRHNMVTPPLDLSKGSWTGEKWTSDSNDCPYCAWIQGHWLWETKVKQKIRCHQTFVHSFLHVCVYVYATQSQGNMWHCHFTSFNLLICDLGQVISIFFLPKSTNFKLILKRRDEAATLFSVADFLQSSAPALNISVNCHNFSESKVKVETGGQRLSYC